MEIVIIGMGKLGFKLAEILSNSNNNISVVDVNEVALNRVANRLDVLPIKGNGAQLKLLQDLDMKKTELVAAVTSSDETNLLICSLAKELGCSRVVARVRNPDYTNQIEFFKQHLGVDFITNPELDTALDVARYMLRGYTAHMESFAGGKVGLFDVPMHTLPALVGKQLREIDYFGEILVAAISRGGQVIVPSGATFLEEQDILYLIGRREVVSSFVKGLSLLGERHITRKAMILGGGKAGYYLATRLLANGIGLKIIEQNEERCAYLVENLKGALVIWGDGTDLDLLQDEGLEEMDALISLTGNDEENLMLALLGKQQGVPKVVAKVSRSNFVPIIEQLGIDRAVNPVLISAGEIVRFIQGGQIASLSLLFGGQAEVIEIIVAEDAPIAGKKLAQAKIPAGVIIGAIVKGAQVIIPKGNSIVEAGDRVIVFCLHQEVATVQELFYPKRRGMWHELWSSGQSFRKSPNR